MIADDAVVLYELTCLALAATALQRPDMGQQLMRNTALNLAEALRMVSSA